MKKIIYCLFFALLLLAVTASAKPLYRYENVTELSNSVTLSSVREFYEDYNLSYSYIKVDLTDDNTRLDLLKSPEGADVLSTVKNLAEQNDDVITAINGDFFSNEGAGLGFSLGIEVRDGNLLQSPIYPDTMATVGIYGDEIIMSYMEFSITAVFEDETEVKIRHLNKHTSYYGDVLMYTSDWNGGISKAVGGNVTEYVFEDNVLAEIRRNAEPIAIPENGFILVVDEGMNGSLFPLKVGDSVDIKIECSLDAEKFETAFGSGSMLVFEGKDVGKIGDYAHTVAGFHPRSAVGVTQDKKTFFLVAVDGRQTGSRGMRMSHLAELLIELGCYYGVNLDGGGSTSLVAKDMWGDTYSEVNNPTETRKVINAVGVVHDSDEESGVPVGIAIKSDSTNVFIDDSISVEAVLFDKYKRKAEYDDSKIEWQAESGTVENGVFYPEKPGFVVIGAVYDELYSDIVVNVIKNISGINSQKKKYMNVGDTEKIELRVFDEMGNSAIVKNVSNFVFTSSDESVVVVKDGKIIAKGNGNAIINVSYCAVETNISLSVGSVKSKFYDSFENVDRAFVLFPDDTKGDFSLSDDIALSGLLSGKFTYDFTFDHADIDDTYLQEEIISLDETETEDVLRAVYYVLDGDVPIERDCDEISVYVYAQDSFGHILRAELCDEDGNVRNVDFEGELTANEWSLFTAKIPSRQKSELSLSRIYVQYLPGEERNSGEIYIDDLSFTTYEVNTPQISPNDIYRQQGINTNVNSTFRVGTLCDTDSLVPTSLYGNEAVNNHVLRVGNSYLLGEGGGLSVSEDDNAFYVHIDASNGGIRSTSSKQWQTIADISDRKGKKYLFITCDGSVFGDDDFENEVIVDFFSSLDKEVFIVQADNYSSYTDYGSLKIFTLDNSPTTSLSLKRQRAANVIDFYFGEIVTFEFSNI